MPAKDQNRYELLKMTYDRVAGINGQEQSRLYRAAGAYIAAIAAITAYMMDKEKNIDKISPLLFSLASIASTYYVIWYTYSSVCLIDTAYYLNDLWKELCEFTEGSNKPLQWEGYSPPQLARKVDITLSTNKISPFMKLKRVPKTLFNLTIGKMTVRKTLNLPVSTWRFVASAFSISLALLALWRYIDNPPANVYEYQICIFAVVLALLVGLPATLLSFIHARRWYARCEGSDIDEQATGDPGEDAGKVWRFLHENGPTCFSAIVKELRLNERRVDRAAGWLAREGKIRITLEGKTEHLATIE